MRHSIAASAPRQAARRWLGSGDPAGSDRGAQMLANEWQVSSEVWSVTSFCELAREAREVQRQPLFGDDFQQQSHLQRCPPGVASIDPQAHARAREKYAIDASGEAPWNC